MTRIVTHHLTVAEVHDGRVICTGRFATADGKGIHSLLRPVLHHCDIERDPTRPLTAGDSIMRYDTGAHEHRPRPY